MNYKPILFSTPMVQAILQDRKTQTRRTVKMPKEEIKEATWGYTAFTPPGHISFRGVHANGQYGESFVKCPYGQVGDVLWVREEHYRYGQWKKNGLTEPGRQKWKFYPDSQFGEIRYFDNPPTVIEKNSHRAIGWYKRLARFMPKSACRILSEISDIRVERLQDITDADALVEGLAVITKDNGTTWKHGIPDADGLPGSDNTGWPWNEWEVKPSKAFEKLWSKINGPESWQANPWVWVVSFKRIDKPASFNQ